ncbi:thymidylate synthase [Streptomyces sp. NPDC088197]|uniref:thymidylate synthase n=1 Tax=Streptomyces sp. NPDC088197 TaxID=3365840 RepID=UPI00381D9250
MITFAADSVAELFAGALGAARKGQRVSPRGMATREVLDVGIRLTNPRARLLLAPPTRVPNPAFAVAETVWILSGSDAPWIFDFNDQLAQYADDGILRGAYGPRLRRWGGSVDQLRRVVEILKADPDSRRALIQLYDPARDAAGHRDVPCTLGFQFHLRHGRLDMATSMRGQDVWIGLPYDLFFYTTLHELVAGWLGVETGDYRHHVGSLHVYERDMERAAAITSVTSLPEMPELSIGWDGFDGQLARVQAGEATGHAGWDAMAATMHSYRLWKQGRRDDARRHAENIDGPLHASLAAWYAKLAPGPVRHGNEVTRP